MATIARADVAVVAVATLNNPDAVGKSLYISNDASIEPDAWRAKIKSVRPE
jgi:hypothetical protein